MGNISSTDPLRVSPEVCVGAELERATPIGATSTCQSGSVEGNLVYNRMFSRVIVIGFFLQRFSNLSLQP